MNKKITIIVLCLIVIGFTCNYKIAADVVAQAKAGGEMFLSLA
jgi:hypothetical protein